MNPTMKCNAAIDLTGDSEDESGRRDSELSHQTQILDDDTDPGSDVDDVQLISSRRCVRQKKRNKIVPVLDQSKTYRNGGKCRTIVINNLSIQEGSFVEFRDRTFMRVSHIYPDQAHRYILIGTMFTRITEEETLMPKQRDSIAEWRIEDRKTGKLPQFYMGRKLLNEVYQRLRIPIGERKCDEGLWRRSAKDVIRIRTLQVTNLSYELLHSTHSQLDQDERQINAQGSLICRWKEVILHDEYGRHKEHRFERPSFDDLDHALCRTEQDSQQDWRGPTDNLALPNARRPRMIDGFCGAGGMSSAAQQAGIEVTVSFDFDERKVMTHAQNFPGCNSLHMDAFDFIKWARSNNVEYIDILHLSPPCQPFSPANTTPNIAKNEVNSAALFACREILAVLRPRIVTIEESPGIKGRHHEWFDALVEQFTFHQFSVRWAILACRDFGVPQLRKRLIMIAAAPGEDLPPFPQPTHHPENLSIRRTLEDIELVHRRSPLSHHDPFDMSELTGRSAYDANCLAKTITCKGGDNYHPSAKRQFTIREYLALQTFPYGFGFPLDDSGKEMFTVGEMRTQLGNAVPPLFGRAIMQSILKSLRARDRRQLTDVPADGSSISHAILI